MNVSVVWYPYDRITSSCATMLNEMLDGHRAKHVEGFSCLPIETEGAVVVFHGQHERTKEGIAEHLNRRVASLEWVLFVSVGDEGCEFPYSGLEHKNMRLWLQTPKPGKIKADRYFIEGYHPNTHSILEKITTKERPLDCFFAGQVTHERRKQCVDAIIHLSEFSKMLVTTNGFFQGMPLEEYYEHMRMAKIVPCPAGPLTPDSFRFAEALESGAIPILDAYSPDGVRGYWGMVLGPHPFSIIEDWRTLPNVMREILEHYEENQRLSQYWWKSYKMKMRTLWLGQDLVALGAV